MHRAANISINKLSSRINLQILVNFLLKGYKNAYWTIIKILQAENNAKAKKG